VAPDVTVSREEPLDNGGRDFFTDQIGDGVAPSTLFSQVKRTIDDACQVNAYAAFLIIK